MHDQQDQPKTPSQQSVDLSLLIIKNVKDYAIFMLDTEGLIVSWNPGVKSLFGYQESEFVGQFTSIIFTPEDVAQKAHLEEMKTAAREGRADDKRWHIRKDGSRFWANGFLMRLLSEDGEIQGFAKILHDDTSQKQAEEELRESREVLRLAMSGSRMGAWTRDLTNEAVYWSPELEAIFGLPQGTFSGNINGFYDYVYAEDKEQIRDEVRKALAERRDYVIQFRFHHADSSLRWMEGRGKAVYANEGNPVKVYGIGIDITDRKQAEEALRQSDAHLRLALDISRVSTFDIDLITDSVQTDDTGREIYGWEEDVPLTFSQVQTHFHPDDRDKVLHRVSAALAPEGPDEFEVEQRIIRTNGEIRWIKVRGRAFFAGRGEQKRAVRCLGTYIDITQSKQAEALLLESERKFSTLAEFVPQMVWMAEPDGFIFWYNQNWYEYTGTTPKDMEGWGWQSVHDPQMLRLVVERWQASIQTGDAFEMEFPLRGADGKFRWFLTRVNPLRDENGRIIRWFGTNTNVDEQRRVNERNKFIIRIDEAVRSLENPQQITLTLARLLGQYLGADRCAYAEVEADEDHFVIPGDYTRDNVHSIVGRYSMSQFGAEVLRLMRANKPYVVHDVNTDNQVTEADLAAYRQTSIQAVICVPLHKNGRFSACMAVHQMTPRQWLPEEVELVSFIANRFWESIERARIVRSLHESLVREREARKIAEDASRLKDEFLATLSHELRTPLNAILGWAQMLQTNKFDEAAQARALKTIERNARAQNQLVEDLLDVSRIITGKLRLNIKNVDLPNIITASVEAIRPAAEAKDILLETVFDPSADFITGDPDRLQQVIWNLLSNAVKFTQKGGRVEIRLEKANSYLDIIVKDTGKGIEPEFLPFVFDRFRQADQTSTRKHGGLGLGLAIVRQLVELHGGQVRVESGGEGLGTTFTVSLPLSPFKAQPAENEQIINPNSASDEKPFAESTELQGLQILVVDDEPDAQQLLEIVLSQCGAQVTVAASASEAIEQFKQNRFDLVITDIGMPEENGYSLIEKLRSFSSERGEKIPAVALTAYARSEDRIQALRSGFQMHIAKPIEPNELIAVVAALVNGNKS